MKVLIASLQQGCVSSREDFAIILFPYLRQIVKKYYQNDDDIDSTTGWIIIKLLSSIDRFDTRYAPMGYIYRAARNYCIDEYRKDTARHRRESDHLKLKSQVDHIDASISFYLDENLSDIDSEIVRRRFINDQSPKEIAKDMNLSLKRVKEKLYRAEYTCRNSERL